MRRALSVTLFAMLTTRAWAFTGDVSDVDATIPRSNCSVTTSTYCVSDSDCPTGQTCVHQAVLSAPMRSNFSTTKTELGQLKSAKVSGAASSTDNAIVRFDGTGGKTVQDSGCTIADAGNLACTVTSGSAFGLSVASAGSGALASILNSSTGSGFVLANSGAPTFQYSGTASIQRTSSGDVLAITDPDSDGLTFKENGAITHSNNDLNVSAKNYEVAGSGTYAVELADRTFTPSNTGDDSTDYYTALKSDSVAFDIKNSDYSTLGIQYSNSRFRHLMLGSKLQATGTSRWLGSSSKYTSMESRQEFMSSIANANGQTFNIVAEQKFNGALDMNLSNSITQLVMRPLGMTTSGSGRTSGELVLTGIGIWGNDSDEDGPIRVLSTDHFTGIFMAPVEQPSSGGVAPLAADEQVIPIAIHCKNGSDSPTCKGRSYHMPPITIGVAGAAYSGTPGTSISNLGATTLAAGDRSDAILNVYAANDTSSVTASTRTAHIQDDRTSSTASIEKVGLRIDATGAWNGSGAAAVANDLFVSGGTSNIALRVATTGNAQLNVIPKTTTLTCNSGSTCTWSSAIPDGATVRSVTARVNTAITGCTSIDIGDGSDVDMWGATIGVTLGTTTTSANYTTASAVGLRTATTNVVVTCNGGTFSAGVVRLTAIYDADTAATS